MSFDVDARYIFVGKSITKGRFLTSEKYVPNYYRCKAQANGYGTEPKFRPGRLLLARTVPSGLRGLRGLSLDLGKLSHRNNAPISPKSMVSVIEGILPRILGLKKSRESLDEAH